MAISKDAVNWIEVTQDALRDAYEVMQQAIGDPDYERRALIAARDVLVPTIHALRRLQAVMALANADDGPTVEMQRGLDADKRYSWECGWAAAMQAIRDAYTGVIIPSREQLREEIAEFVRAYREFPTVMYCNDAWEQWYRDECEGFDALLVLLGIRVVYGESEFRLA